MSTAPGQSESRGAEAMATRGRLEDRERSVMGWTWSRGCEEAKPSEDAQAPPVAAELSPTLGRRAGGGEDAESPAGTVNDCASRTALRREWLCARRSAGSTRCGCGRDPGPIAWASANSRRSDGLLGVARLALAVPEADGGGSREQMGQRGGHFERRLRRGPRLCADEQRRPAEESDRSGGPFRSAGGPGGQFFSGQSNTKLRMAGCDKVCGNKGGNLNKKKKIEKAACHFFG